MMEVSSSALPLTQDALGDVVFVELPEVGESFDAEDKFGVVESVKTVSDLYAPCGGEI